MGYPDDKEPEDMKCRRLAALKEFGRRNPTYQDLIEGQLKLERRRATERTQASPWGLTRKGQGQQTEQKVVCYPKKRPWTTKGSVELLDAVTRFEKSDSRAVGKEKWTIIAADLMQQPNSLPDIVSLAESAVFCRTRYCNMLARRHAKGSPYGLPDELKVKLEEFSRVILETRPSSRPPRKAYRKNLCTAIVQKKSRTVMLARSES